MALEIDYVTKNGEEKRMDISSEATSPFGYLYQDRVKTPLGNASVIGVCDGRLWFHVDGHSGASHWSSCITADHFLEKGFVKIQAADDPLKLDPNEFHRLKKISFNGKEVNLVMQNVNGPCPIIALANALALRGELPFLSKESFGIVKSADLRSKILEHIKTRTFESYKVPENASKKFTIKETASSEPEQPTGGGGGGEAAVDEKKADNDEAKKKEKEPDHRDTLVGVESDATRMGEVRDKIGSNELEKFYQGIDVSPIFTEIDGFDYDRDALTFALAGVRLVHGWVLDEESTFAKLRDYSYDDLMIVLTDEKNEHSPLVGTFLSEASSQLTEAGLTSLQTTLENGEICVLFRNNHFSTLIKTDDQLMIVVSDEGYVDRTCVVFEELNLFGGGQFFDGDVYPVEGFVLSVVNECGDKYSDDDIRTAAATLMSESETGDPPSVEMIIDRLKKDAADAQAANNAAGGGGGTSTAVVPVGDVISHPPADAQQQPQAPAGTPTENALSPAGITHAVEQLAAMGFDRSLAKTAMEQCGSIEEAIGILTS